MAKTQITAGLATPPGGPTQVIAWVIVDGVAQQAHLMDSLEARLYASLLVNLATKVDYQNAVQKQKDPPRLRMIKGGLS